MKHSDAAVAAGNAGGGMGVWQKRKEEVAAALDARGCSLQTLLDNKESN